LRLCFGADAPHSLLDFFARQQEAGPAAMSPAQTPTPAPFIGDNTAFPIPSVRATMKYPAVLPFSDILPRLHEFDAIIDVRSPSEFAEDHLPGAINLPVLNDEERVRVGTLYKQTSAFEAKKLGAALIAKNIAQHIEDGFLGHPQH
jgi:hypothetical protein